MSGSNGKSSLASFVVTGVLTIVGALGIWVAAPLNGFLLGNSYIAGDFMPVAALAVMFLLVLVLNPLLRRFIPVAALSRKQCAFIFGVMLVACVTPEAGVLRNGPNMLAREAQSASRSAQVAKVYDAVQPPASLFPDPIGYGEDTPVSDAVIGELHKGEKIQWGKWLLPLISWGAFLLPYWLMMMGLALIVLPQWRDVERQPMPLLKIQQMIVEEPRDGHFLPPIFRNPLFWTAAGIVFFLHGLTSLSGYLPGRVPSFPLGWNLSSCFTEGFSRNLPGLLKASRISFIFLGLAFFMPTRTGFSIWAMQVIYGLGVAYAITYRPPYDRAIVGDHRAGAVIAIAAWVLWSGRRHWQRVFGTLLHGDKLADDGPNRVAAILFLSGLLGMAVWLIWVGASPGWAAVLSVSFVINALVITRMVSETGIPVAPYVNGTTTLVNMLPMAVKSAANVYYGNLCNHVLFGWNRICAATMVMQGAGMDERTSSRGRVRLGVVFLLVLVVSLVVAGAVHVVINSENTSTLNGRWSPIGSWGAGMLQRTAIPRTTEFLNGTINQPSFDRFGHILVGIVIAAVLQILCQTFPRWPLHPVSMLLVLGFFAKWLWASVFIGWLCKVLILRYGGSHLHRKFSGVFLGFILGEAMAVVFWTVVTGVLAGLGMEYGLVTILPD